MGDEAIDLCECIWSHDFAMRRLLNLLRQSQTVCTDNECFDEILYVKYCSPRYHLLVRSAGSCTNADLPTSLSLSSDHATRGPLRSKIPNVPRLPGVQAAPESNLMLMIMAWMAFALVLFLMRPRSLRNKTDADYRNNEDDNGRPPMPPAVN